MNMLGHSTPRLSVVMPSLQQGKFIEAAVHSVFDCPDLDIELVVADGGSTDGTQDRLARMSSMYPGRLYWTSQPDGGPASAVNRAFRATRAPIIGWLNSDDLFHPGAISRALAHFDRHPNDVMVYGEGDHVDEAGRRIAIYPTQPPTTPTGEFSNGCFICQPTVFLRREAFVAAGALDESLRASFDFDLWLRMFIQFPGRIGFVRDMQASTRLHDATITAGQRARVALEGIKVTARHLGRASPHWLKTYFDEIAAEHPFHATPGQSLLGLCETALRQAETWLSPEDSAALAAALGNDRGVALATPWLHMSIYADGWAPPSLSLKMLQPEEPITGISLHCRHCAPHGRALQLTISIPGADDYSVYIEETGTFELEIEVTDRRPGARLTIKVICDLPFIPAASGGSSDKRELCFVVDAIDVRSSGTREPSTSLPAF